MTALLTLRADLDSGEGNVPLTSKFDELSPLMKADLLKDWIGQLGVLYTDALADFDKEYDSLSTEATVSDGGNLVAPHSTVGTAKGQVYSGGRC